MTKNSLKALVLAFLLTGSASIVSLRLKDNKKDTKVNTETAIEETTNDTHIGMPIEIDGKKVERAEIILDNPVQEQTGEVVETPQVVETIPIETPTIVNTMYDINAYYYLDRNANLFEDKSFDSPIKLLDAYEKVFVQKANEEWAYVTTDNGLNGYMESFLLKRLPDNTFVEVDLSDQTTKLYNNHNEFYSTSNVTGKDSTPTDIGYFDIDEKSRDTYLRAWLPNGELEYETFVNYWMPYNAGEGLHDAPWQNGHFGDTNWHHSGGSHGCVNMPNDAAEYIYNNVEVGTRVLVHK